VSRISQKYKTFDFLMPPVDYRANDLVMKRVYSSIALEMKNKGLTRVTNNADLLIAVHTGVQDKVDVQHWGYLLLVRLLGPQLGHGVPL
jgi:hypothetical protein